MPAISDTTYVVPTFGGGLNFGGNPAALRDDEWTWSDGWVAKYGCAEILPQYVAVKATGWLTANYLVCGLLPNPFSLTDGALIFSADSTGTGAVKWYKLRDDGTLTQVTFSGTDSGGGAQDVDIGATAALVSAGFLNGYHVISFGCGNSTGNWGLVRWTGAATYTTIKPTGRTRLAVNRLISFAGHLIGVTTAVNGSTAQAGSRTVEVSAGDSILVANPQDTWNTGVPATDIANDSGTFTAADNVSGFTAVVPLDAGTLGLYTRQGTYGLTTTGGFPPFTFQFLSARGGMDLPFGAVPSITQYAGLTPLGPVVLGADDFYLSGLPVGQKVIRYWLAANGLLDGSLGGVFPMRDWQWHPVYGVLCVPSLNLAKTAHEVLLFDPMQQTWARRTLPSAGGTAWKHHAIVCDNHTAALNMGLYRHWITTDTGSVYAEDTAGGAHSGAFVDTKDFTFGNSTELDALTRIRVEWEPLTNKDTDALKVYALVRDDFTSGVAGASSFETSGLMASATLVGTLTAGKSELSCRLKGKVIRLRFQQSSGRVRIRSFTMIRQPGSAKAS